MDGADAPIRSPNGIPARLISRAAVSAPAAVIDLRNIYA
jgi:hypothetical protein